MKNVYWCLKNLWGCWASLSTRLATALVWSPYLWSEIMKWFSRLVLIDELNIYTAFPIFLLLFEAWLYHLPNLQLYHRWKWETAMGPSEFPEVHLNLPQILSDVYHYSQHIDVYRSNMIWFNKCSFEEGQICSYLI